MAELLPENGICPKCAQELLSHSSTCPNCGHRLPSQVDRGLVSTLCTLIAAPLFCGGACLIPYGMLFFSAEGYVYSFIGLIGLFIAVALLPLIGSESGKKR